MSTYLFVAPITNTNRNVKGTPTCLNKSNGPRKFLVAQIQRSKSNVTHLLKPDKISR